MSRRTKGLLALLGLAATAAAFGYHIQGQLARGEHIFWLAELWPPAAVLSIGLVTCLEFLVPADHAAGPPPRSGRSRTRASGRRRA
jgi:hypothetical protein